MVMVTRLMYLLSGVIVLATGIYVQMSFNGLLADTWRVSILLLASLYFAVQLYRLLRAEWAPSQARTSRELSQQFRA